MFNTYNAGNMNISAVSGTLVKTYKDSFFKAFHYNSRVAEKAFDSRLPNMYYNVNEQSKAIVVIQCMNIADGWLLAEIMWKEDFEAMFEVAEPMAALKGE